jgi:general secretion pathway protein D
MTGKRFIYGPKVRSIKATVVSPAPVTLAEAYEAFLSILEANGMTVIPHGRFLKIVDSGGVVSQATPVYDRGEPVPRRSLSTRLTAWYVGRTATCCRSSRARATSACTRPTAPDHDDTATTSDMIRIVEEIDVGGAGQRMWIEPVHHGSATDMAKRINELFELQQGGQAGAAGGAAGAGTGGLSKVVADDQTNSLVVVGTEDSYMKLLELMKRLDNQPTEEGKVHVMPLQHASPDRPTC